MNGIREIKPQWHWINRGGVRSPATATPQAVGVDEDQKPAAPSMMPATVSELGA